MVDSLLKVASSCSGIMRAQDSDFLEAQREEKLNCQELIKENYLEKAENNRIKIYHDIRGLSPLLGMSQEKRRG